MASNDRLRKEIVNLKTALGSSVTPQQIREMLTAEQRRVFNANIIGTKRVVKNTARVVPVPVDKAKLRTHLFKAVKDEGKTTEEFIASLDSPAKKQYIRELLSNISGIQGYCPLTNLGNTCFLNATMQLLYSIPELKVVFSKPILDWQTKEVASCPEETEIDNLRTLLRDVNVFFVGMERNSVLGIPLAIDKIRGKQDPVYDEMIQVLKLQEYGLTEEEKKAILTSIGKDTTEEEKKAIFKMRAKRQEDAGEFLNKLFSKLFCFSFLEPLAKRFEIVQVSSITCKNPDIHPSKIDKEKVLNLSILDPSIVDIQTALEAHQQKEVLTKENNQLQACSATGEGTGEAISKELVLQTEPTTQYVLLTFIRNLTRDFKISKEVNPNPIIRVGSHTFKLRMCVCHLGPTADSGHYVSYGFDDSGLPNSYFSDDTIKPLSGDRKSHIKNIKTGGLAYLYEKIANPIAHGGRLTKKQKQKHSKKRHTRKH